MNTQTITHGTNQHIADPRQKAFRSVYYDPESPTYSNAYRSALAVGYSQSTSKDLLHNRPAWLSETWGGTKVFEPDQLLAKLTAIVEDRHVSTREKLKAIELLMKYHGMLRDRIEIDQFTLSIESVLA